MYLNTFLLILLAINFPLSIFLCHALPRNIRKSKNLIIILFTSIGVFIPILGTILILFATPLFHWFQRQLLSRYIRTTYVPEYQRGKFISPPNFGEGDALRILNKNALPITNRMQALAAINILQTPNTNIINRSTLRSDSRELRLFAFTLLNYREKIITEKIDKILNLLKKAKIKKSENNLKKALCFYYWELIYHNLLAGELMVEFKERFYTKLETLIKNIPHDASLWVLLGKYHMLEKDYKQAEKAFIKALNLKAPYTNVLPYLAEIYFIKKDFYSVRHYLGSTLALKDVIFVNPLIEFWCHKC